MSDDLISRKDFITEMEINIGNIYNPDIIKGMKFAIDLINSRPTAFDKEKVIEELVELRQKEYSDSDEEIEIIDGEEIYDEGRSQGRFEAYHRAIKIVEKGGIE